MGDTEAIAAIEARILELKESFKTDTDVDPDSIISHVETLTEETRNEVSRTNKLIEERTSQKASLDSDQDKVSDFDEINLFKTNPFTPDSDNDGFLDGVEILGGYNPLSAEAEALIQFESPKTAGVVREDILKIKSITAATPVEPITGTEDTESQPGTTTQASAAAVISGVALPNSFITLFIFSTPIIVTLRTDNDGSWNYRLDKELEDGEHEMYIGVTDNAGRIVAKSSPFLFVKQAEAFSGVVVDAPAPVIFDEGESFFSSDNIFLVLGVSTVAIGLILMLLGIQLQNRRPRVEVAENL
jgi:hypothetical protein